MNLAERDAFLLESQEQVLTIYPQRLPRHASLRTQKARIHDAAQGLPIFGQQLVTTASSIFNIGAAIGTMRLSSKGVAAWKRTPLLKCSGCPPLGGGPKLRDLGTEPKQLRLIVAQPVHFGLRGAIRGDLVITAMLGHGSLKGDQARILTAQPVSLLLEMSRLGILARRIGALWLPTP
jgi:hypothetical protein